MATIQSLKKIENKKALYLKERIIDLKKQKNALEHDLKLNQLSINKLESKISFEKENI